MTPDEMIEKLRQIDSKLSVIRSRARRAGDELSD